MHPSQEEVESIRLAVEEKTTYYYYLALGVDQLLEAGKGEGVFLCSTKTTFPTLFFD